MDFSPAFDIRCSRHRGSHPAQSASCVLGRNRVLTAGSVHGIGHTSHVKRCPVSASLQYTARLTKVPLKCVYTYRHDKSSVSLPKKNSAKQSPGGAHLFCQKRCRNAPRRWLADVFDLHNLRTVSHSNRASASLPMNSTLHNLILAVAASNNDSIFYLVSPLQGPS